MYGSYGYDGGFPPYVSVAERRREAAAKVAALKKSGREISPVKIDGRKIATTFWGKSWCENLEAYSDFASRLPRGRSYVRNGLVIHLAISPGEITALVSGSDLYEVSARVAPLPKLRWGEVVKDCAGKIDSVMELLGGNLSDAVMDVLCRKGTGLFPAPKEISLACSCPDGAYLCKHLAAVLYGVGARLDAEPELLFALRQVKKEELVSRAVGGLATQRASPANQLGAGHELSSIFGIELEADRPRRAPRARKPRSGKKASVRGRRR